MSDKRAPSGSRVTPARRVGDVKPVPIGNLGGPRKPEPEQERRLDEEKRAAFERGLQTGLARGRKEGYDAARVQLEKEHRETALAAGGFAAQRLESALELFSRDLAAMEESLADQVVDLSAQLARQVINQELATSPQLIRSVVRECLAMLPDEIASLKLRLHPDDMQWIEQAIEERQLSPLPQLFADPQIEPGGCIVDYSGGSADARLTTRWSRTLQSIGQAPRDDTEH